MKRLWILALTAVALLAWTVPSMAVDFSGQLRVRGEMRQNPTFNEDVTKSTAMTVSRARLTGVANPADDVTVKLTIQDTRMWGAFGSAAGGPDTTDTANTLDLHEAYMAISDFFGYPVDVKIGRQAINLGDQRLIGGFEWSNNARSFDAITLNYGTDAFDILLADAKIVEGGNDFNDTELYIGQLTVKSIANNTLDLYIISLRDNGTNFGALKSTIINTYGFRLNGSVVGLDYTLEAPFQSGEVDNGGGGMDMDISGNAYAVKLGYTIPGGPMGLRVGAEYDYASGDDDGTDNDWTGFLNLYPTNHAHYGYMDRQAWRNMTAWNINGSIKPNDQLFLKLDYWNFSLAEETDGVYYAGALNGGPSVLNANADDAAGTEIDLTAKYKYNDALGIMAGVSQYSPADVIEDNAGDEQQTWAYLQLTANF